MNRTPVLAPVRPRAPRRPGAERRAADGLLWIAAVAAAYTVVQLVLAVPGTGLGWDESVYVSQVARGSEAAFFSAPRARGITFLVAPVTAVTSSVEVLRVFLAVLSGAGLFAALAVWRTLLPPRTTAKPSQESPRSCTATECGRPA